MTSWSELLVDIASSVGERELQAPSGPDNVNDYGAIFKGFALDQLYCLAALWTRGSCLTSFHATSGEFVGERMLARGTDQKHVGTGSGDHGSSTLNSTTQTQQLVSKAKPRA